MKAKRIFAMALAMMMSLSIVACNNGGSTGDSTGTVNNGDKYDKNSTIKFGLISALSGENASQGQYAKEGAELFKKSINEAGGVLGKKIEIIYEDEASSEQQGSIYAALKLATRGDITGIFGTTVSSTNNIAIMPTIAEYKIPLMAGGSSANIKKENNPFVWQARMSDDLTGVVMAKSAVEVLGMKNPAIIHGSDSFGAGLAIATTNALKKNHNIQPKIDIVYNPNEKQYTPFLSQILNSGADGIIAISHQVDAGVIMKQVAAMGIKLPVIGSTSYVSEIALSAAKEASNGWYAIGDWTNEVPTPEGKKFVADYRQAYNREPDMPSAFAYDSFAILAEAVKIAGTADPVKVNDAIAKVKALKGVASTFTPDEGRVLGTSQFLVQIVNGKAVIKQSITR